MPAIPSLLKQRKFPFLFALFLCLLLLLAFLLVSDSQIPFPIITNLNPLPSHHNLPLPPPASIQTANDLDHHPFSESSISDNSTSPPPNSRIPPVSEAHDSPVITNVSSGSADSGSGNDTRALDVQWNLCKGPVAVDYIPCLDNWAAIRKLKSRKHMEHRERHCPSPSLRCLVPLPEGYKVPVQWPKSRDMVRSFTLWW